MESPLSLLSLSFSIAEQDCCRYLYGQNKIVVVTHMAKTTLLSLPTWPKQHCCRYPHGQNNIVVATHMAKTRLLSLPTWPKQDCCRYPHGQNNIVVATHMAKTTLLSLPTYAPVEALTSYRDRLLMIMWSIWLYAWPSGDPGFFMIEKNTSKNNIGTGLRVLQALRGVWKVLRVMLWASVRVW